MEIAIGYGRAPNEEAADRIEAWMPQPLAAGDKAHGALRTENVRLGAAARHAAAGEIALTLAARYLLDLSRRGRGFGRLTVRRGR